MEEPKGQPIIVIDRIDENSYFDGGLFQLIGWQLLGALITIITLGICYPWACCMIYNWTTKHTVINGRRLKFTGTPLQLFGNWIKWLFLTLITFFIYSFWLNIKLKQWIVKHTEFAEPDKTYTYYDGSEASVSGSAGWERPNAVKRREELDQSEETAFYVFLILGGIIGFAGVAICWLVSLWGLAVTALGITVLLIGYKNA